VSDEPLVTVVIPVRNEAADLGACLERVLAQSWPRERLEVVVADGGSTDGTVAVAKGVLDGSALARWTVVDNPAGTTPSNLNAALGEVQGTYVCRVDARSLVQPHHVSTCVEVLAARSEVAVVGGAQEAEARQGAGFVARGIARALRNPYATGLARYRRGGTSGATDTVYLGAFRADDLRAAGGWDERFRTNQDYELNRRLGRQGVVWYDDRLAVTYRPRETLRELLDQYRRFGRWKAAAWLEGDVRLHPRQAALLAGPPVVAVTAVGVGRRHPIAVLAAGLGGAVLLDLASREPAPLAERASACLASAVVAAGWWCGAAEQAVRRARGERLLR
jgi:succinoglycan biosynthesis protein ExoA